MNPSFFAFNQVPKIALSFLISALDCSAIDGGELNIKMPNNKTKQ
jgi:hypothetical protein